MTKYWKTVIAPTVYQDTDADPYALDQMIRNFEELAYVKSVTTLGAVDAIQCTGGRLYRHKSRRPHIWLLKYRSVFAIVRQDRSDGKRGTLVLLAVWRRDENTYNAERLRALIARVTEGGKK